MTHLDVPLVYVISATWNQRVDMLECLASLERMPYPRQRAIVIDNGSEDGTAEAIQERFPDVQLICNGRNRGFAAAVNQGLRVALDQGADYFLVLNNDTVADPAMLDNLLRAASAPAVGMTVPKIYYYRQPNVIWSIGALINWWTYEIKDNVRDLEDDGQWQDITERQFATLCAALIPRGVIEHTGFLDERFFVYYDDADWSLRLLGAGYRILLVPQAKLWHKVARSSGGADTPYQRYWLGRSSVLYFRKHVRGWRWLIVVPYRLGSALKTTARLLARGRIGSVAAYWRGLRDGFLKSGFGQGATRHGV
jgi:GT2 family glycosyltransferase